MMSPGTAYVSLKFHSPSVSSKPRHQPALRQLADRPEVLDHIDQRRIGSHAVTVKFSSAEFQQIAANAAPYAATQFNELQGIAWRGGALCIERIALEP